MGKENKVPIKERPGFQKFVGGLKKIAPSLIGAVPFIGGAAGDMVESIIDQHASNKEEAMNAKLLFRQWEVEELRLEMSDRDSARRRESEVAKATGKNDWLVKNIVPLLAISIVITTMLSFVLILSGVFHLDTNLSYMVIGGQTSMATGVIGYYFGSSTGSKDKQAKINELIYKQNE